jgi:hypothetical protein
MEPAPRLPSPRRRPSWLLSGGALFLLLALLTGMYAVPRFLPKTAVVISPVESPYGGVRVDEEEPGSSIDAAIDAELDEFLQLPEFHPLTPARTDLDFAFDAATTIEFPISICSGGFEGPLRPRFQPDIHGRSLWKLQRELPEMHRPLVTYQQNASEIAVANALQWLAAHQQPDGGWSFAHRLTTCPDACQHEGKWKDDRVAATALTLLPFLGAGQTHKTGKYKKQVEAALYFLVQQMKLTKVNEINYGIFLTDTNLSAQSLSTLAICEAYSMTFDKGLMKPAQFALNQLLRQPAELDDGFRWLAIRSGDLAYLNVKAGQSQRGQLLSAVLSDRSKHKFAKPSRNQALVAVGCLDRWIALTVADDFPPTVEQPVTKPTDDGDLQQVLKWLGEWGPASGDLDYQYFATQCLRQTGGEGWFDWHKKLREQLPKHQEKAEHLIGSWHFAEDHGADAGGRLYCTAMATMILEVYFRHLPVYAP